MFHYPCCLLPHYFLQDWFPRNSMQALRGNMKLDLKAEGMVQKRSVLVPANRSISFYCHYYNLSFININNIILTIFKILKDGYPTFVMSLIYWFQLIEMSKCKFKCKSKKSSQIREENKINNILVFSNKNMFFRNLT